MVEIMVKILFFGKARELVEKAEGKLFLPAEIDSKKLRKKIFEESFPQLRPMEDSCMLAIDQNYINPNETLQLSIASEIAVIPPLSGG